MSRWHWAGTVTVVAAIGAALWWARQPQADAPVADPVAPPPPLDFPVAAPAPRVPPEPEPISGSEAAVELAGANGVVCSLQPAVSGGTARLLPAEPSDAWLAVALVGAGYLVLSDVPPQGSGTLRVEGFAPVDVQWSEALEGPVGQGGCTPEPLVLTAAQAAIVGTVHGAAGRGGEVTVEGCGQPAALDADGGFYLGVADGERCEVTARRHLGVLAYVSDPIVVTARAGTDTMIELSVPDIDAVIPVVIDDTLRITSVWADLDLVASDRIVAIDGQPAPSDAVEFYTQSGGAAGDVVDITVEAADGSRRDVAVELAVLGFEDWLINGE